MKDGTRLLKTCGIALLSTILVNAHANNISFEQALYSATAGSQINVTVSYDFTSHDMFGGGFNLIYDPAVLEFVAYIQAEYSGGLQGPEPAASPLGELVSPGNYVGVGIGTFEDAFGISNAGDIGTFVFVLLQNNPGATTPCGATMCLTPNLINPFVSVVGDIEDDEIFSNGIAAANVQAVPLPASVWFFVSASGAVFVRARRKNHLRRFARKTAPSGPYQTRYHCSVRKVTSKNAVRTMGFALILFASMSKLIEFLTITSRATD